MRKFDGKTIMGLPESFLIKNFVLDGNVNISATNFTAVFFNYYV